MSPKLDTGDENVQCTLRSSIAEATYHPLLWTYGLEMCGESDLCMHCDIDEMTRIANSNRATKTRSDIASAPVV